MKENLFRVKKYILVMLIFFLGSLLTLSGFNLIQLSSELVLYSGIGLLIIAVLYYFIY